MKWKIEVQITEVMQGGYQRLGKTFRRTRKTRKSAEDLARAILNNGFRRRLKDYTVFYPAHRIWSIMVKERD